MTAGPQPGVSWWPNWQSAETLRLLSYNIQAGISTRRFRQYVTQGWRHVLPHPESRDNLDRIADLARHYDVVGLQEVDAGSLRSGFVNQTEYLARKAGFRYWHHQTNRNLGKLAQHSNGLLSRLRPTAIVEHRLPGRIPGRGAMLVRYGFGRRALIVLIVHLSLGRRARIEQIAFVRDLAGAFEHVILMGDLNCTADSAELRSLLSGTHLQEPSEGLYTFPSWRPLLALDHILVSESLRVRRVAVLNQPFSDHLPICMEVAVPPGLAVAATDDGLMAEASGA